MCSSLFDIYHCRICVCVCLGISSDSGELSGRLRSQRGGPKEIVPAKIDQWMTVRSKTLRNTKNRETVNYIWQNNWDRGLVDIFARGQLPPDSREMHTVCNTPIYKKLQSPYIYHFGQRWKLINEPPCTFPGWCIFVTGKRYICLASS